MTRIISKTLIAIIAAIFLSTSVLADTHSTLSDERIKELALEAILENPEIIEEATQRLQQLQLERQQAGVIATLETRRTDLERDPNASVLGNPDGDVTLVEFFDYNCPYCKRAKPEIEALLKADPEVRLVFRELPILSEGSMFGALAARKQGKYEKFHWALMSYKGQIQKTSTLKIARDIGLNVEQLQADMEGPEIDDHIRLSMELAEALNINGTPSFVVGDNVYPGLLTKDQLIARVAEIRSKD